MIDNDSLRQAVVSGLKEYLNVPVIRSNQNVSPPPYPFISFTVTTLESENNGTWEEWENGVDRKAINQTWSISALADNDSDSITLASNARTWLDHTGKLYLNDHRVIMQSITAITNRDNILTADYEYKNGFDVVFSLFDEIENPTANDYIDTIEINDKPIQVETTETLNELLEKRLDGE